MVELWKVELIENDTWSYIAELGLGPQRLDPMGLGPVKLSKTTTLNHLRHVSQTLLDTNVELS